MNNSTDSGEAKGFGGRLTFLVKSLKHNGNSFAKEIHQGNSKVYQIMRGEVSPSVKFCEKVYEAFPEINFDWLITGRGEPVIYRSEETGKDVSDQVGEALRKYKNPDYRELWETARELLTLQKEQINRLKEELDQSRSKAKKTK